MFSRSLLLVLLVLACLQSFTSAQNAHGPGKCCFDYQKSRIPAHIITAYKEADRQCTKSGVIFTLKKGREVCADPEDKWVKNSMKTIDQRKFKNLS